MADPKQPESTKTGEQDNATTHGGATTERGGRDAGMPGPAKVSGLHTGDQPAHQPETKEIVGVTTGGQKSATKSGEQPQATNRDKTTD